MTGKPDNLSQSPRRVLSRRGVLVAGAALATIAGAQWITSGNATSVSALSARDAHTRAVAGEVTLIDIRRPDEWTRTGVGEGAIAIDMRAPDFIARVQNLMPSQDAPVALICARGVRSGRMARRLAEAGFTTILDVPEGMLGSDKGVGWIAAGLPVRHP